MVVQHRRFSHLTAWAHLILYGEEATKAAQKEGEEAAAAFEKEKQDIANGKQPAPTGKVEKKKKTTKKEDGDSNSGKRKRVAKEPTAEKKAKPVSKTEKDAIGIALAKAVGKVSKRWKQFFPPFDGFLTNGRLRSYL